jgi:hypothetical protein
MTSRDIKTVDCYKENNRTVDCHSQESKFESGVPRCYSCCGKLRYTWDRFAKRLFLPLQTAVQFSMVHVPRDYSCCGKRRYWSAVCHKREKSNTSNCKSTVPMLDALLDKCNTYICAVDCLGLNYTSMVSVCHTISWQCPFDATWSNWTFMWSLRINQFLCQCISLSTV